MDPRWKHPFSALISGSSGSGKTTFVVNFLKNLNHLSHPLPERIVWIYGQWQPVYKTLNEWWKQQKGVETSLEFREGVRYVDEITSARDGKRKLLILDDVMHEADDRVTKLFTKGSHHLNISVMFLVQNLFYGGNREHRTISLNASYIVVFKNPRDARQIEILSNQMYPGQSQFLREVFTDVTSNTPHAYILLDMKQSTPDALRVRSNIFPECHKECFSKFQSYCVFDTVYVPLKGGYKTEGLSNFVSIQ